MTLGHYVDREPVPATFGKWLMQNEPEILFRTCQLLCIRYPSADSEAQIDAGDYDEQLADLIFITHPGVVEAWDILKNGNK